MDFYELLNNFAFPVVCVIALGIYAKSTTNRLLELTEKVTNVLSENANAIKELAETIKDFILGGK